MPGTKTFSKMFRDPASGTEALFSLNVDWDSARREQKSFECYKKISAGDNAPRNSLQSAVGIAGSDFIVETCTPRASLASLIIMGSVSSTEAIEGCRRVSEVHVDLSWA